MKGRRILVFSRDPGGTNAVLPLIEPLRTKGNEVVVYGKDMAPFIYRRMNMDCLDIRDVVSSGSEAEIDKFVRKVGPDLIVTGTSSEDFTERHLWKAAEKAGIASFAVLDQWTNYRLRLVPEGEDSTNGNVNERALVTPSFFFIMDELAKEEMSALGIDRKRLVVTGQPFFDYVRDTGERFAPREVEELRRELTGNRGGMVFVFASQPITSIHRQNGMAEDHWGYTEQTVLKSLMTCLRKLVEDLETRLTLVIRLHPKDKPDAYAEVLSTAQPVNVIFNRETDSALLLKAADLVIGMFSMVLLEAAILERPFISVQIGLKRQNPLILDRIGLTRSIVTNDQLEKALREVLNGDQQPSPDLPFEFGAAARIVQYLEAYR
jgi:CDP-Glycerol:Poly(glycerophosphate) glycerophosphotransferase